MHCTCKTLLSSVFAAPLARSTTSIPPTFLAPALALNQTTSFSTSTRQHARKDGNPARGVSALRRTGLKKQRLSITAAELPKPVLDPSRRSQVEVDEDHGLWEFFPSDRKSMATPEELVQHGRSWDMRELRHKDWDDLHRLWWVCIKEKNRLLTYKLERERVKNLFGQYESDQREDEIKKTMKRIKQVLTERWYTWENARQDAMQDEEINMYADLDAGEPAYLPKEEAQGEGISDALSQATLPPPGEASRPEVRA
ncbi:54S ribosomal protein L4, mitochondrial [Cercospora beticola]|uniref:Large ribosomal subunit protein uL29m n=1 Tax=Cercospora beticola TaxID=122368 RepID=A0A2G5HIZ3_CERBT|nr:54S ribosomal protein L4, mitochondrial [Cercospora beticola]PIA92510.1 54S ribosomal protein L4, mitochondrial [Cercospora beticola]WPB01766.1 hypothetical protein RHO25_006398 [Cercospora beticola]